MALLKEPIRTSVTIHMMLTTTDDKLKAFNTLALIERSLGNDTFVTHVTGLANVPGSTNYTK